jgi:hypothetical protein
MWHRSVFDALGASLPNEEKLMVIHNPLTPLHALSEEDDVPTSLDSAPFQAPRHESYIGVRPQADEHVADAVRERHEALDGAIALVEATCEAFDSSDVSGVAAQQSLRCRVGSLSLFASALEGVASRVEYVELEGLFAENGILSPYLAGMYMWAGDVTETLGTLARDLNSLSPDWAAFRERLAEVRWIFDMTITEGRRLQNMLDVVPADLHEALDDLLVAAISLDHKLSEPFG